MKYLIDTSILVEAERQRFDLGSWLREAEEVHICDATVAEYLAGQPLKDEGKRKRWREFWRSLDLPSKPLTRPVCERAGALLFLARSKGKTVPLGDSLHAAVAELQGLEVLAADVDHFLAMGVKARNPLLESPPPPGRR
ncbi:MAG: type II toxin-antitoxin system VapC family toxin [Limisphaerales bacterium]